jgi:ABC-type transporter Mla subunit MlaD
MAINTSSPPVRRTVLRSLENIEALLIGIHDLLVEVLSQEENMAAEESAEAKALNDATAALAAEVAEVGSVDAEVAADLQTAHEQLQKVAPVSVEQVNAVAAVTTTLTGLTQKLKAAAAGGAPAAPAAPAEAASPTATAGGGVAATPAGGVAPSPAPGQSSPAAAKAVYTFDAAAAGATEDPAQFSASGFRVPQSGTPPLAPLFYFSGDSAAADVNGASVAGYVHYTGDVEAVPAAA